MMTEPTKEQFEQGIDRLKRRISKDAVKLEQVMNDAIKYDLNTQHYEKRVNALEIQNHWLREREDKIALLLKDLFDLIHGETSSGKDLLTQYILKYPDIEDILKVIKPEMHGSSGGQRMYLILEKTELALTITGGCIAVCFWSLVIIEKVMGII